jgi:hypothetical protein
MKLFHKSLKSLRMAQVLLRFDNSVANSQLIGGRTCGNCGHILREKSIRKPADV